MSRMEIINDTIASYLKHVKNRSPFIHVVKITCFGSNAERKPSGV